MLKFFRKRYRVINTNKGASDYPYELQLNRGFDSMYSWVLADYFSTEAAAILEMDRQVSLSRAPRITIIKEIIV